MLVVTRPAVMRRGPFYLLNSSDSLVIFTVAPCRTLQAERMRMLFSPTID
jgi:hypothetical protein